MVKNIKKSLALFLAMLMLMTTIPVMNVSAWDNGLNYVKKDTPWNNYPNSYAAYLHNGGDDYAGIVLKEVDTNGVIYVEKGKSFDITLSCGTWIGSTASNGGETLPSNDLHWHYGNNTDYALAAADGKSNPGNSRWRAYLEGDNSKEIQSGITGTFATGATLNEYRATSGEGAVNQAEGVFKFTAMTFPQLNTPGVYSIRLAPTIAMNKWKSNSWNTINGWGRFDYDINDWTRTIPVTVVVGGYTFKKYDGSTSLVCSNNINYSAISKPGNTASKYVVSGEQSHQLYTYSWPSSVLYKATSNQQIPASFYTTIYNGSNERGSVSKMQVTSDGEANNTSIGILKYPVFANADSIKLNLNYSAAGFLGEELVLLTTSKQESFVSPTNTSKFSSVFGTGFSTNSTSSFNYMKSYLSATEISSQMVIPGRTGTFTFDITDAVNNAKNKGQKEITFILAVKTSGNKGNGGWSDVTFDPVNCKMELSSNNMSNGTPVVEEIQTVGSSTACTFFETNRVNKTCTTDGYVDYVCLSCGQTKHEVLTHSGHNYVTIENGYAASCQANGKNPTSKCEVCGDVTGGETIPLTGHTRVTIPAKDPTCKEVGYTSGVKCSVCDTILEEPQVRETVDHKFLSYTYNGDATCAEDGTETANCVYGCGEHSTRTKTGSKTNIHTFDTVGEVTKKPTCISKGQTTYTCTVCKVATRSLYDIPATGEHTYTVVIEQTVDATCTKDGTGALLQCSTEGCTSRIREEAPKATGIHNYNVVVSAKVPATCKDDGKEAVLKCATCTAVIGGEVISKTTVDHIYSTVVTSPTCTSEGYSTNVCTVCGTSYIVPDSTTQMSEHNYVVTDEGKQATCKENGITSTKECSECHKIIGGEVISKETVAHTETVIPEVAPTCQKDGSTEGKKCSVCGIILESPEKIEKVDHSFVNYVYNNDATCAEDGTQTASCKYNCGTKNTIKKAGTKTDVHTFDGEGVVTKEATCISNGEKTYTCTVCNIATDVREEVGIDKVNGHQFKLYEDAVEPTCALDGHEKSYKCDLCKEVIGGDVINATGDHKYTVIVADAVEATCSEDGSTTLRKCKTCDDKIGGEVIPATGLHTYSIEKEAEIPASCNKNGTTAVMKCITCERTRGGEVIPMSENLHAYVEHTVESTCTTFGYLENVCTNCNKAVKIPNSEIAKKAHNNVLIAEGKEMNCLTPGKAPAYECTMCGLKTGGNVIPRDPDAHTLSVLAAKEPTCTTPGLTEGKKCIVCTKTIVPQNSIPATGHDFDYSVVAVEAVQPTCVVDGRTERYACKKCDGISDGEVIPSAGKHTLKYFEGKAATCLEEGWNAYEECEKCDYTNKVIRPKVSHIYSVNIAREIKAGCETAGSTAIFQCKSCNLRIGGDEIPATGHKFVNHSGKEPTCLSYGYDPYVTCENCNYTTYEEKSPTGEHVFGVVLSKKVEPTCTSEGREALVRCVTCTLTIGGDDIPAIEHVDADGNKICDVCRGRIPCDHPEFILKGEKDPTCITRGYTGDLTCVECGMVKTYGQTIPTLEHKVVIRPAVPATCTSTGLTEGSYCTMCEQVVVRQTVIPVTHKEVVVKGFDSTCDKTGLTDKVYCSECGAILQESKTIAKKNHTDNNHDLICDDCGNSVSDGCDCVCHSADNNAFSRFFHRIRVLFWRLFGTNKTCKCGIAHY